jgi:ribosomal protein S18 acetylase RimI-like enzyme
MTRGQRSGDGAIRAFADADEAVVVELWRRCGLTRPWNDPHADIARKRTTQRELFLVLEVDGEVVGTAMGGFEGHRGWVNYLAVAPELRHRGFGRMLMAALEQMLAERGCPKLNLQVRTDNAAAIEFYTDLGYARDDVVSLGKRLVLDGDTD